MPDFHLHHLSTMTQFDGLESTLRASGLGWRPSDLDPVHEASEYAGGAYLQTIDWRCGDDEQCADGQFHQRLVPEPFAYMVRSPWREQVQVVSATYPRKRGAHCSGSRVATITSFAPAPLLPGSLVPPRPFLREPTASRTLDMVSQCTLFFICLCEACVN